MSVGLINNSSIENRPAKNLDKKNKILFFLERHENGNSYSQGSSYSREVRDEISFILEGEILRLGYVISNKDLLDEELIDELYNVCLTNACSTEEDRKKKAKLLQR